jgi:FlaA1/EpsC-like NDP-sugar epimerase
MGSRDSSPASATFRQLTDMGLVLLGVVAAMVVGYQFFRNRDNFVIASCVAITVYATCMLYVTNKNEFMRCLGQDEFMYKLIRYATMSIIMLAVLTAIAAYGTKRRGRSVAAVAETSLDSMAGKGRRR